MQFKEETKVFTEDGREVGNIDQIVMDPKTKEVTHVVVRKGFLFTEDKLVPIDLIDIATEDHVMLRDDAPDPDDLPRFEETHFVPLSEEEEARTDYPAGYARPVYWYPPVGAATWGAPYPGFPEQPLRAKTERNIPEDTVSLQEGATVVGADGEEVGDIERVFADPESERVTHFLVSEGLLLKEKKLVPAAWAGTISGDQVELVVSSSLLDDLPEYKVGR